MRQHGRQLRTAARTFAKAVALAAFLVLLTAATPARAGDLPDLGVELHAHLFMKEGLGWLFRGDFDDPIQATSWSDRLSSKANPETLDASGNGVVVISLFAHPIYAADMRQSVRRQLGQARAFVARHPGWEIATSAQQARELLQRGIRVFVLSLEGASGVLESEDDLREFIDEGGIRIVAPLHLVDDRFGGAAMLDGEQYSANPLSVVDQLLAPHGHSIEQNRRGLTPTGRRLVVELLGRGVWIDLTHSSDAALAELVPMVRAAGQPLLVTHTSLRRHRSAERALSEELLREIGASRGVVGLLPSNGAFQRIQVDARFCGCEACPTDSVAAFAQMAAEVGAVVGRDAWTLGSDWNGGMRHLPPACGTGTSLDRDGLVHMGQTRELWDTLVAKGVASSRRATLAHFLAAWQRVVADPGDHPLATRRLPRRRDVQGPSLAFRVGLGAASLSLEPSPGLWLELDALVRKDMAFEADSEPVFYTAHSQFEMLRHRFDAASGWPHVLLRFAPVGVRAGHRDNQLGGELVVVEARRRDELGERLGLRAVLLGGRVRTMPALLRYDTSNTYLEVAANVLGYDGSANFALESSERAPNSFAALEHGVFLGGGRGEAGWTLLVSDGYPLSLFGFGAADITVGGFGARANYDAGAGLRIATPRGAALYVRGGWHARRAGQFFSTQRVAGGLQASF